MKLREQIPLPIRMWIARARSVRSMADLIGRFGSGALRAYVAPSVRSNRWRQVSVAEDAQIHRGTSLHCNDTRQGKSIVVGARSFIGQHCFFSAGDFIDIGRDCLLGASCNLLGAGHAYDDPTIPYASAPIVSYGRIVLEPNVWLGTGVTVVGDVRIGFGSVVAAGTLLREGVPPLCMVAGQRARIVKLFDWRERAWRSVGGDVAEREQALDAHRRQLPTLAEFSTLLGSRR